MVARGGWPGGGGVWNTGLNILSFPDLLHSGSKKNKMYRNFWLLEIKIKIVFDRFS
jgi:hypothetical protein